MRGGMACFADALRLAHCVRPGTTTDLCTAVPCLPCTPAFTPALLDNEALEAQLCTVPGLPGNAVCLVFEPVLWPSRGQDLPQPLLGIPGSCIHNIFVPETVSP